MPGGDWLQHYIELLESPGGEYIQSEAGQQLLRSLLTSQSKTACPVKLHDNRIAVCDPRVLSMVRFILTHLLYSACAAACTAEWQPGTSAYHGVR